MTSVDLINSIVVGLKDVYQETKNISFHYGKLDEDNFRDKYAGLFDLIRNTNFESNRLNAIAKEFPDLNIRNCYRLIVFQREKLVCGNITLLIDAFTFVFFPIGIPFRLIFLRKQHLDYEEINSLASMFINTHEAELLRG